MKVLVVSQYFYPENFRVNMLCVELVNRGHDVTVLTGYPQYPKGKIYDGYGFNIPYEKEWNGVKIERVEVVPRGNSFIGLFLNCLTFVTSGNKWVKECKERYDAVYVFEVSPVTVGLPAVKYKKKFGTPIFFNVQDLWPENVEVVLGIKNKAIIGIINKIVDSIYSASDIILCSSKSFAKNISIRGVEKEKLVFWPQFCEEPKLGELIKPKEYEDDFFNIVFAGNIGDAQGLDMLVDAASRLKDIPVRWYIVGDGRALNRLQEKVQKQQINDRVIFVGRVSEEAANCYIHYADCAYLSFLNNQVFNMTLPAKLQSYLACGTPILAAAGGECKDFICDNECGFVVEQDGKAIATCVREIMAEDLSYCRHNAQLAHDKFFNKDKLISQLEELMRVKKRD